MSLETKSHWKIGTMHCQIAVDVVIMHFAVVPDEENLHVTAWRRELNARYEAV
jgi:hypothetical protein